MDDVTSGVYKHYKGSIVYVLGSARHTETQEEFVVYIHPDKSTGQMTYFVRPREMFLETVMVDGKQVPRFTKIIS